MHFCQKEDIETSLREGNAHVFSKSRAPSKNVFNIVFNIAYGKKDVGKGVGTFE